jgi:hypothetical protein
MRKLVLAALVLAALGLLAGPAAAQEADLDCKDFGSQAEAQAKLEQGLPFTGPRESLLPLGLILVVVGAAAVAVTRYRGRHAAR